MGSSTSATGSAVAEALEEGADVRLGRLQVLGWVLLVVGVAMAALPFIGPPLGVPFDGTQVWQLDADRLFLHVLPGIAGAAMGAIVILAYRRRVRRQEAIPRWLPAVVGGALVMGVWMATGPWLLQASGDSSALMFKAIPHFNSFSALHQVALEAGCHWIPGLLSLSAAWAAWIFLRALPKGTVAAASTA